jgi:hypothetical protein
MVVSWSSLACRCRCGVETVGPFEAFGNASGSTIERVEIPRRADLLRTPTTTCRHSATNPANQPRG